VNDPFRHSLVLERLSARLIDLLLAWILSHFYLPGVLLGAVYLAAADGMEGGGGLGKRAMGLQVLMADGSPCTLRASVYRNLPFILFPVFLRLGVLGWVVIALVFLPVFVVEFFLAAEKEGARLGDRVAGTRVVKAGA
jgi:uncharacterized RDD family membrane protein YckC